MVGVFVVLRATKRSTLEKKWKVLSMISGILLRVIVMDAANILLLPVFTPFYKTTQAVILIVPFISIFNAIQGAISVFGGFLLYEAISRRLPSLKSK
jgi:uncharacterized membrane protein YjjP (DUF1212 family)